MMEEIKASTHSTDRLNARPPLTRIVPRQTRRDDLTPTNYNNHSNSDFPPRLSKITRCRCVIGSILFLLEFCTMLFWIGDVPAWMKVKQYCS